MKSHPAVGDIYAEDCDGGGMYLVLSRDVDSAHDTWDCLVLYPSLTWHERFADIVHNTENWLMNACVRLM